MQADRMAAAEASEASDYKARALKAADDIAELISSTPTGKIKLLELASLLAQTKLPSGKNFENSYGVGRLSEFLCQQQRFFMMGMGPMNSRTVMLYRSKRSQVAPPPGIPIEPEPAAEESGATSTTLDSPPQSTKGPLAQDNDKAPVPAKVPHNAQKPPGAEILFTKFLFELGRPAHLGSDAGVFLRKNGLVSDDVGIGQWLLAREFLYKRKTPHHVELMRQGAGESLEDFLDKVFYGLLNLCKQPLHLGSHLGVLCKWLGVDMNKRLKPFFMARPARYRIVKNDFIALNASITAGLPETRPAPMARPDTANSRPLTPEIDSAILHEAAGNGTAVSRSASSGVEGTARAESAAVQTDAISFGQYSPAVQDEGSKQDKYAALASENAALHAEIAELRSDYKLLRQDVDGIKQRLFMTDPVPLFGGPSKQQAQVPIAASTSALSAIGTKDANSILDMADRVGGILLDPSISSGGSNRRGNASTAAGSIACLGGHDGNWLYSCATYTPGASTGRWGWLAQLPQIVAFAESVTLSGSIFLTGGGDGSSFYNAVLRLPCQAAGVQNWQTCAPMLYKRGNHGAVSLGDKMYCIGGGQMGVHYKHVDVYDPERDEWQAAAPLNSARSSVKAVALDGAIYVAGGYDGTQYTATAERFDPREGRWTTLAGKMGTQRGSHGMAAASGGVYCIGGQYNSNPLKAVEKLDTATLQWTPVGDMHCERMALSAVSLNEKIYAIGGTNSAPADDGRAIEHLDPTTGTWTQLHSASLGGSASFQRSFAAACVVPANDLQPHTQNGHSFLL
ncbi:hypothetical protein WJX73_007985 [Symbiochloris irregularis]|uniref:Uncharacterized protein n=1 Tax=Symbiochloris irregularis TaxID=706552 RepID=A0AAW1NJR1_9CHLO